MIAEPTRAVVIGASAGAVQALLEILPALPAAYPLPVLIDHYDTSPIAWWYASGTPRLTARRPVSVL